MLAIYGVYPLESSANKPIWWDAFERLQAYLKAEEAEEAKKRPSSPPAESNAAKKLKTDNSGATPETPTPAPAAAKGDS